MVQLCKTNWNKPFVEGKEAEVSHSSKDKLGQLQATYAFMTQADPRLDNSHRTIREMVSTHSYRSVDEVQHETAQTSCHR